MVDFGLDDFDEKREPREGRENVPEGVHTFRLKRVAEIEGDRVELWLEHPDKRYGYVFSRTPKDGWGARVLSSLRKATGLSREEWIAGAVTDLVGRVVKARIFHRRVDDRVFVNVGEFLPPDPPAAPQPAPAATAKRTTTQKADAAAAMPADDIPF